MIELEARHLEVVKKILSGCIPTIEVRAFGSRVAGGAKRYSDLDLVLMGSSPLAPSIDPFKDFLSRCQHSSVGREHDRIMQIPRFHRPFEFWYTTRSKVAFDRPDDGC